LPSRRFKRGLLQAGGQLHSFAISHATRFSYIREGRVAAGEALLTHAGDHDGCAVVWGVFASVGPAIDAAHMARIVEGEARVLRGDGFQVASGFDVQGALEAAGCASLFAEDEGEIGAGAVGDQPASRAPAGAPGPCKQETLGPRPVVLARSSLHHRLVSCEPLARQQRHG